jgi:VCBS repeat-containing protein
MLCFLFAFQGVCKMLDFSWNQWLSAVEKFTGSNKGRKVRRTRTAHIELLEDRALLTANLPIAVDDAFVVAENTTLNGTTVLINDTDVDSNTIDQATLQNTTAHGTLTLQPNGTFTYVPDTNFVGIDSFTYFAVDSAHAETSAVRAVVRINVGSVADAPPTATPTTIDVIENTPLNGGLSGNDPEETALTFLPGTTSAVNGTVVMNAAGKYTFTPTPGFTGAGSFTFRVSDGTSTSANATVTVNVLAAGNTAPVGTPATFSVPGSAPFTGTLAATDVNGDPLVFAGGLTAPTHGTVTIGPGAVFTYVPTAGYVGPDSFTFTVSDGQTSSAQATVTLHVGNSVPVVTPVSLNTPQDTPVNSILTATDLNGDTVTFREGTTVSTHGTVVIQPNGSFVFTPQAGYTGPATFSFIANDGIGDSTLGTATIQVGTITNVAPDAVSATVSTPAGTATSGFLSATDTNGDTVTFAAGPTAPAHGTVVINPNGSYTYTPANGFNGIDTFSFTARDGSLTSSPGLITVQVGTQNTAPVVLPVTVTTIVDVPKTGTLTGTDVDGNLLTFAVGATAATHGAVVINPDGTYTFTPAAGFVGIATFSYKANDGTVDSPEAIVTVNVLSDVSTAPVVVNGTGTTTGGTDLVSSLSPLGTDPQNDSLTFSAVTQPAHGTLALSPDGTFTYTPDAGFTGADSFTFKANDGTSDSNLGTFSITVNAAELLTLNLAPTGTIATKTKAIVPLDTAASFTHVDPTVNFANTTIQASFTDGSDTRHDRLLIKKIRGSDLKATCMKIKLNGHQIATISGGRHGQPLVISFDGSATQATVTAVLQRIGAKTTKSSSDGARTVKVDVTAGAAHATDSIILSKV